MYALSKLNRQNEQTWVNLQKWLNEVQFSYAKLFPNSDVHDFIKNKAVSVGSCKGYFIPLLLTTTVFFLASKGSRVKTLAHNQPLNIFTIFVGYPGTGKHIVSPLENGFNLLYTESTVLNFFLYSSILNTIVFIFFFRKVVPNSACHPKSIRTLRVHFFNYQQNNVLRIGQTTSEPT